MDHMKLDHASRSCSTWVAVGDVASTSQLPSPHGGHSIPPAPATSPAPPIFTAADLIRSVNKKVSSKLDYNNICNVEEHVAYTRELKDGPYLKNFKIHF